VSAGTFPAEPTLHERSSLVGEGVKELRAVARYRNLLRHLVRTSLARENTGTVFGSFWWLLDPLILIAVYFLFVKVILGAGEDNFVLFIFIGISALKYLSTSVTSGITSIVAREQLMRQVAFPRSVIPLASGLAGTFHFLLALGLFVVVAVPLGITPGPTLPLVLAPLAVQVALVLGLAYLLSSLNVFFRDIQNLTGYVFRVLLFLSPVLYTLERVPERILPYYMLNPLATIIPAYRDVLMYGQAPDWGALAIVGAASAGLLAVGFLTFVRLQHSFTKVT
jgi:ABC-type polysaccharide/polyol phosphate export permease